jgi:hypothetical protein
MAEVSLECSFCREVFKLWRVDDATAVWERLSYAMKHRPLPWQKE